MRTQIRKLSLNGCGIDRSLELYEKSAEEPDITNVSDVTLHFSEKDPVEEGNCILVPVYETESREKIVMSLNLQCKGEVRR